MRYVDRGAEPAGVAAYRRDYTHHWVDHVQKRMGSHHPNMKPYWLEFKPELAARFNNKCGYCERICRRTRNEDVPSPTVDHFKPKSKFPTLVCVWENWIFSCDKCNEPKGDQWPETGYIDPCSADPDDHPEKHLDVDERGRLLPKKTLAKPDRQKAGYTIHNIGLNEITRLFHRVRRLAEVTEDVMRLPKSERHAFMDSLSAPDEEYAGVISILANRMRQAGEI